MTPVERRILELYYRDLSVGHIAAIFKTDPDDVARTIVRLLDEPEKEKS